MSLLIMSWVYVVQSEKLALTAVTQKTWSIVTTATLEMLLSMQSMFALAVKSAQAGVQYQQFDIWVTYGKLLVLSACMHAQQHAPTSALQWAVQIAACTECKA